VNTVLHSTLAPILHNTYIKNVLGATTLAYFSPSIDYKEASFTKLTSVTNPNTQSFLKPHYFSDKRIFGAMKWASLPK
jgi:hypothetical protein